MSFEEIAVLLKADTEKQKRVMEIARMGWFYSLISSGFSKAKTAKDICTFEWEKKPKKEGHKFTKEELDEKAEKAKKILK